MLFKYYLPYRLTISSSKLLIITKLNDLLVPLSWRVKDHSNFLKQLGKHKMRSCKTIYWVTTQPNHVLYSLLALCGDRGWGAVSLVTFFWKNGLLCSRDRTDESSNPCCSSPITETVVLKKKKNHNSKNQKHKQKKEVQFHRVNTVHFQLYKDRDIWFITVYVLRSVYWLLEAG